MKTGWWNPSPFDARSKFHFVTETGRTLCGRYIYLRGELEDGKDDHLDNCAICRTKKLSLNRAAQHLSLPGGAA